MADRVTEIHVRKASLSAKRAAAGIVVAQLARQSVDEMERMRAPLVKRKLLIGEEIARIRVNRLRARPSEQRMLDDRVAALKLEATQIERELRPLALALKERGRRNAESWARCFVEAARQRLPRDMFSELCAQASAGTVAGPDAE